MKNKFANRLIEKIIKLALNDLQLDQVLVPIRNELGTVKYLQTKNEILHYQGMHQIKLEHLRNKVTDGKKVRVLFLNLLLGQFGFDSIYKTMEKSDLFEPYILVLNPWENQMQMDENIYQEVIQNYNYFQSKGYRTLLGYDENCNPVDIAFFSPDIIFYNNPNLFHSENFHKNVILNQRYLTCYVNYAINVLGDFNYHYNNYYINTAWINFSETRHSYLENVNKSKYHGYNAILSGYPKLDKYQDDINWDDIPEKIKKASKIVIYAPHWSIYNHNFDLNLSTFHLYYLKFEELRENYPDVLFVFKPHPILERRIEDLEKIHKEIPFSLLEYHEYIKKWDNSPNGIYINDGEYIDIFKLSDCLITDSGSFIAEYLPSGNPCIYLFNPERVRPDTGEYLPMLGVNELGKKILSSYYCCNNFDEVIEAFESVVIKENDPQKENREKLIKTEFYNIGSAGEYISKYLEIALSS